MCYFAMLTFKKIKSVRKMKKFCVSERTDATLWGPSAFPAAAVLLFHPHPIFTVSQLSNSFCA